MTDAQINQYRERVPDATEQEPMAKHTSFRVGGVARLYVVASSSDALVAAVRAAKEVGIPWFVYGGGSNLLVADAGYDGVVIQAANRCITVEESRIKNQESRLHAEAGAITAMVARKSVDAGLTGFEWAIGVPGTVGGAVYGNAGCFGGEMKDAVVSVDVYDPEKDERNTLPSTACGFGYRDSAFKRQRVLILGTTLALAPAPDPAASRARMDEVMRLRKEKQPLEGSSCGCVFKNVDYTNDADVEKLAGEVEIPASMLAAKRLSAGWLIEQAGLLGQKIGDVEVSEKHGNFFLNRGKASAADIVTLISLVKRKVRDDFGIELHEEAQYLGF